MKIKVEERERNACRIRRKLPFSVAKHRGSETRGSEMSVIRNRQRLMLLNYPGSCHNNSSLYYHIMTYEDYYN